MNNFSAFSLSFSYQFCLAVMIYEGRNWDKHSEADFALEARQCVGEIGQ